MKYSYLLFAFFLTGVVIGLIVSLIVSLTPPPDTTFRPEALEVLKENGLCVFEDYSIGKCYPDAPKN